MLLANQKMGRQNLSTYHGYSAIIMRPKGKTAWVYAYCAAEAVRLLQKNNHIPLKRGTICTGIYNTLRASRFGTRAWKGWEFRCARGMFTNGFVHKDEPGWSSVRKWMKLHFLVHFWREKALAPKMEYDGRLALLDRIAFEKDFS